MCVFRADRKNKMAAPSSDWLRHFRLLLWNRSTEFNETWQEARSQHPLPRLCFSGRSENKVAALANLSKKWHIVLRCTICGPLGPCFSWVPIFRRFNKNDTLIGLKIRGHCIFLHDSYRKFLFCWVLEFVGRTLHENQENWYPRKFKTFTVFGMHIQQIKPFQMTLQPSLWHSYYNQLF